MLTGFGKILIYQRFRNVKSNANGANDVVVTVSPLTQKEQIEEMEEIEVPSIVWPTKENVFLPIREANYKLGFSGAEGLWM